MVTYPWENAVASIDDDLYSVLRRLQEGRLKIVLVLDDARRLQGVITDGDLRRCFLKGSEITELTAADIMNTSPITLGPSSSVMERKALMQERDIYHLPIVDNAGVVKGLETIMSVTADLALPNQVVLMAGGLGSRLGELTQDCPKPLLHVGGKPILETILERFASAGYRRFLISVNYRAEMIEGYFGDGRKFGVEIGYLREDKKLGTAGALSLIGKQPTAPFFVMNGDVLTKIDLRGLSLFHHQSGAAATMCVRNYNINVPFGVVDSVDGFLTEFREKPSTSFMVNAGIYMLDPKVLSLITKGDYLDMPDLLQRVKADLAEKVALFPVHEYWHDIGRPDDFEQAQLDYEEKFND